MNVNQEQLRRAKDSCVDCIGAIGDFLQCVQEAARKRLPPVGFVDSPLYCHGESADTTWGNPPHGLEYDSERCQTSAAFIADTAASLTRLALAMERAAMTAEVAETIKIANANNLKPFKYGAAAFIISHEALRVIAAGLEGDFLSATSHCEDATERDILIRYRLYADRRIKGFPSLHDLEASIEVEHANAMRWIVERGLETESSGDANGSSRETTGKTTPMAANDADRITHSDAVNMLRIGDKTSKEKSKIMEKLRLNHATLLKPCRESWRQHFKPHE